MPENNAVGKYLLSGQAYDVDLGAFGTVSYSVQDARYAVNASGAVSAQISFDCETAMVCLFFLFTV